MAKTKLKAGDVHHLALLRLKEIKARRQANYDRRVAYYERKFAKFNSSWVAKIVGRIDPKEEVERELHANWREGWLEGEYWLVSLNFDMNRFLSQTEHLDADKDVILSLEDAYNLMAPIETYA